MAYTVSAATTELRRFGRWRTERVLEIGAAGDPDLIHGSLLLAIASRETNLRNIVGGGYFADDGEWVQTGEDRGLFQINDYYHSGWLASVRGCVSGAYEEVYESALPKGRVPGLTRGARKCRDLLRDRIRYARSKGVPEKDVVRVAVAAYNTGSWNAYQGYVHGDPDVWTTGGNYSRDVLERKRQIQRAINDLNWG